MYISTPKIIIYMKNKYLTLILGVFISFLTYAQEAPIAEVEILTPVSVCNPGDCTTLFADYFKIKPTNSYTVGAVNYANIYSYTGGTVLNITTDDKWSPVFDLPFKFSFYGQCYDKVIVGSNGVISFDVGAAGGYCSWPLSGNIPNPGMIIKNAIYGVYQDTDLGSPIQNSAIQNVNYYAGGVAPNRYFVANFNRLPHFSCGGTLGTNYETDSGLQTTQIVIYETTNIIDVYVYKRTPCTNWQSGAGLIGIQNATGSAALAPPGRNTGSWSVQGTTASPSEAWRFVPSFTDPTPPLVQIEWYNEQGALIGTGDSVVVCPLEDQTYTAKALYFRCGNIPKALVTDTFFLQIADPLPVNDPKDISVCFTTPTAINIGQTDYILEDVDPGDYEVFYFLDEAAANTGATSQSLTAAQIAAYTATTTDPVTFYAYIESFIGDGCSNVRPFTVQVGSPSGTFTYPPDTDATPATYCFNSNSALAPVLADLSTGGTYTVIPTNPTDVLTINDTTGVLNLNGATPGTYTIKYTIPPTAGPDGCPEFNTETTIVIEACITAVVSNSGNVCEGTATFNLFAQYTEVNGTTTTYEWKDNDGLVISTDKNPINVPVPATAGTYTYSLVVTQNGTASESYPTELIVHPLPVGSFVSVSTTICTNAPITLVFTGTEDATIKFTDGTNPYQVILDSTGNGEFTTQPLANNTTFTLVDVTGITVPACTTNLNDSILISVGLPTASIVAFTDPVICSGAETGLEIQGTPGATVTYTKDGVVQPTVVIGTGGTFTIPTGIQTVANTATFTYALTDVQSNSTPPCSDAISGQSAVLTVNALPTATFNAVSTTICEGTAATLNFTGTANATVTYNNGTTDLTVLLDGVGFGTVQTGSLSATTTYSLVKVEVTNSVLCLNNLTGNVVITIDNNAAITTEPVGFTKCIGDSVTFSTVATGANLTYQWFFEGVAITNATSATYTIAPLTALNAGNYTVKVTGSCGPTVTSVDATLTLTQETLIATQPAASTTLCVGQPLTLSVIATGTNIAYQWFRGTTSLAGATNSTFSIGAVSPTNAGDYTVVISNPCQTITSSIATVIVNELPVITTQPVGTTVCEGQGLNLSVVATGTNLTYQWFKDGVALSGATAATYSNTAVALVDAGSYTVTVSGACAPSASSAAAVVIVNQTVSITQQPLASTTLCVGQPLSLSVSATGTNITYQWFRGTTSLAGATNSTFSIGAVSVTDAGNYTVVVANSCQTITSSIATAIVNELPVITTQPAGTTICEGQGIILNVVATGTNLTYQWFKDGVALSGATAATYADTAVALAEAGSYTVTVSGACTPAADSAAAVVIVNQGAAFTVQPEPSTIVCSGTQIILTVATTGGTGVTYQWFKGSTAISGATTTTYTITASTVADSGSYTCQVTVASCGTITSDAAVVVVNQAPAITSQPQSKEICVDQSTTFTVVATGTNLTYQWFKDGVALAGEVTNTYSVTNATQADSEDFYCIVTSTSCPDIQSNTVTLLVKPLPTATIAQGNPSTICAGESTQVIFNGTAGAVVSYTINGGTPETITLNAGIATILPTGTLTKTTVYELVSVTYTGPDACSQTLTGSATVTVNPLPKVVIEDGTICVDPITLATTRTYLLNTGLNEAEYTFEWFDVNGSIPLATNSFYEVSVIGQYGVTITDIITGCQASAYANVDQSLPPLDFDYTVSGFFADNPTVVITATPIGNYEYQLDFGPFQESNIFDNITAGTHTITVRDPEACDVLVKDVLVVDYPRYFTPNGDGINDTWTISSIEGISITKITIFDRFGRLLKEMNTSGLGWDGNYNGKELPATDYWFTINYQEDSINKEYRAHFSLKR